MAEIRVPKLNSTDTKYIILEWLQDDGAKVDAGEPVVVVETSKATNELTTDCGGYLRQLYPENAECAVGDVIGRVFPTRAEPDTASPPGSASGAPSHQAPAPDRAALVITNGARRRMAELKMSADVVRMGDRKVVRTADIDALADELGYTATNAATSARIRRQQAVAAVVTRSHATIPAAFVAGRINVDDALSASVELTARLGAMVGLTELVTRALARARGSLPSFFASVNGDTAPVPAKAAHVGITMDTGEGLWVPVIRDADMRPFVELANEMFRHRMRALRGEFKEEHLADPNILLSLNGDEVVEFAVPIIYPGMVCTLSLGSIQVSVSASPDGVLRPCRTVMLGVAYDHRIVNGRQATGLLKRVKSDLESPAWLGAP